MHFRKTPWQRRKLVIAKTLIDSVSVSRFSLLFKQHLCDKLCSTNLTSLYWAGISHYLFVEATYHLVLYGFSVRSSRKGYSQGGCTGLCIIRRKTVITDGANRYGVDTGGVTITVTVIICQTSITSRPHVDVTFAATTLENKNEMRCVALMGS